MELAPIVRALEAACLDAGDTVYVPTTLLRALLDDYQDAADARHRLQGYQARIEAALAPMVTAWAQQADDDAAE
jgi:hypothetical protein